MKLEKNRLVSDRTISSHTGQGGMGEGLAAEDGKRPRRVAFIVRRGESAGPDRAYRPVRERRQASALNCPNVVTFGEIGEMKETYCFASGAIDSASTAESAVIERSSGGSDLEIAVLFAPALDQAPAGIYSICV